MDYIFAIDLSMASTGIAVFDMNENLVEFLTIATKAKDSHGIRLGQMYNAFMLLRAKYNTTLIIVEEGFCKFQTATKCLFKCRGILELVFKDCEQVYLSPLTIKKEISGSGKATKEELQEILYKKYPDIIFENTDVSDAICVGLAYFKRVRGKEKDAERNV
jgi:crossover junction endodeoxyribonuclease RuvC